jgi:opacity protein-like surface antigen
MTVRHILAIALSLGLATPAFAFDTPPPIDAPEYTGSIAAASGWYIRGDLGYDLKLNGDKPTYSSFDAGTAEFTEKTFDKSRFGKDFSIATGAGYQFNDFLRSDLTVDYFSTDFKGKSGWESPCTHVTGKGAYGNCSYRQQDLSALGLLANGYVDLGTYMGLTPYVGAGAGVSYVKWGDAQERYLCTASSGKYCNGINYKTAKKEGADSWRFTYALMAGVSYDVAPSIKLDIGYRYSKVGSGDMLNYSSFEKDLGAFGMKGKDKGFDRSEIRAGLRMTGW